MYVRLYVTGFWLKSDTEVKKIHFAITEQVYVYDLFQSVVFDDLWSRVFFSVRKPRLVNKE